MRAPQKTKLHSAKMNHSQAIQVQISLVGNPIAYGLSKRMAQRCLQGGLFLEFLQITKQQRLLSSVQASLQLR